MMGKLGGEANASDRSIENKRRVSGRPGDAPVYAGTDFMMARDSRIAPVYLFFDKLP